MHYNIQIHIQRVETVTRASSTLKDDFCKVTEILELKVTADTKAGAYERALKVLSMNAPEREGIAVDVVTLKDRVWHRPL